MLFLDGGPGNKPRVVIGATHMRVWQDDSKVRQIVRDRIAERSRNNNIKRETSDQIQNRRNTEIDKSLNTIHEGSERSQSSDSDGFAYPKYNWRMRM